MLFCESLLVSGSLQHTVFQLLLGPMQCFKLEPKVLSAILWRFMTLSTVTCYNSIVSSIVRLSTTKHPSRLKTVYNARNGPPSI